MEYKIEMDVDKVLIELEKIYNGYSAKRNTCTLQ